MNVSTPCVVVDLDIVERNIKSMAEKLNSVKISHRPHIKTHKSVYFAKLQQELGGAKGITCAKISEAEVFAEHGFNDILIAFPLVGRDKLERLYELAKKIKVSVVGDSLEVAKGISDIGIRLEQKIPFLIELDGGIHRCGRQPGDDALAYAYQIKDLPGIDIVGVLSYAGQIYDIGEKDLMRESARTEARLLVETAKLLREHEFSISVVSGGSSISSKFAEEMGEVTEVRAGNYIFHDRAQLSTGLVTVNDCALRVVVTVVSATEPGRAIIDAGSKTLSSDSVHFGTGYGYVIEHPEIEIFKLNEEHGYLRFPTLFELSVGDRLTVIPNHSCVLPNLCDELIGVRGEKVVTHIRVDARGKNV
ncbi:amino acid processing protein [Alicyclobacillaceae bacterium I2511]|nr:amino acid processing protein [Alicyclobacillaceae bacterium I2511]